MSYVADGSYTVYQETVRKARKTHWCSACAVEIRPGDYYCYIFTLYDGSIDRIKRCGACQTIHEHLRELCKERARDMWPDERLNCGLVYSEEWGDDPPEEIARLPLLGLEERSVLLKPKKIEVTHERTTTVQSTDT